MSKLNLVGIYVNTLYQKSPLLLLEFGLIYNHFVHQFHIQSFTIADQSHEYENKQLLLSISNPSSTPSKSNHSYPHLVGKISVVLKFLI
jgi:hypothetical protein